MKMRMLVALAVCAAAGAFSGCQPAPRRVEGTASKTDEQLPRITQFYGPARIARGETGLLCYGTENVVKVSLVPGTERMSPSFSRCIQIAPAQTTTYELTAEDEGGRKTTRAITVEVGAPAAKFGDIRVNKTVVAAGETVLLCFKAEGAASVTGGPGQFLHGGVAKDDCLLDRPRQTTTYKLTIVGGGGDRTTESVTVRVE